jgi:hypothetical protein
LGFDPNRILPTDDAIAQRLGRFLYRSYVEGDQSPQDAFNWTVGAYQDGGKAGLSQQAIEVLETNTPNSVNDRAFVRMGIGEQAATLAKGIYDQLRSDQTDYYSPWEAWTTIWANYLNGNPSVTNSGFQNGGDAGGFNALRALAYDVGLDPAPYLPRDLR